MTGVTPMTISAIFATSPSPSTMNSIGRMASGGIIDSAATNGASSRAHVRNGADRQSEAEADAPR